MTSPYIGQIIQFGGNFAIPGWALCDGQLLAISSHSALFSILGTTYGGDGISTFGLPDLRGRVGVHMGSGPGLSRYTLGEKGGTETVTLTSNQMPSHKHTANAKNAQGNTSSPSNANWAQVPESSAPPVSYDAYSSDSPDTTLSSSAISNTGGGQSHNNLQPFLTLNFQIALEGTYPSRN